MNRVLLATAPCVVGAVYFFGWRTAAVLLASVLVAVFWEWLFCRRRGEAVSSAVFVTAVLYALTMPPGVPFLAVIVGIVVAIVFGKEVFGGFGRNVFNPALVGRCFTYVCFPVAMTGRWPVPFGGWPGGLTRWTAAVDALTGPTPLLLLREGGHEVGLLMRLFLGNTQGSAGETSALLILIGAAYLLYTRTASWRIMIPCLLSAGACSTALRLMGFSEVAPPLHNILAGGMMFGAVFMATDPVSAPQTKEARYVYAAGIGALAVVIRAFGRFSCGVMFSILLMNMFAPIMDHYVRELQRRRRQRVAGQAAAGG